jgi:hypothetical protein
MDHTLTAAIEMLIEDSHKQIEMEELWSEPDLKRLAVLGARATALVDALSIARALDPAKAAAAIISVRGAEGRKGASAETAPLAEGAITITRGRLHADLKKGDRVIAINGTLLPVPRIVDNPMHRTDSGQRCIKLTNALGTDTEWNLYPDSTESVTIERDDSPADVEMEKPKVMTAQDFTVGQTVWVAADQGIRKGEVTKIARTRIHVRHPRNKQGTMVERPYAMDSVIMGTSKPDPHRGWLLHYANGNVYSDLLGRDRGYAPYPEGVPIINSK